MNALQLALPRGLLVALASALPLFATPGSLLDDSFPEFSTQATVVATALADDGGVFLLGDFRAADGIPRPGLARLNADGTLDPAFVPDSPPVGPLSGGIGFGLGPLGLPAPDLFALSDGGVMVLGRDWWELHDPDGVRNENLFPDLPRAGAPVPRPQFRTAERLYLIATREGEPELRAYRSTDHQRDLTFASGAGLPLPPHQAVAAADGKLWVLGRIPGAPSFFSPSYPEYALYRLEEDGSQDPSFAPQTLPASYEYFLRPGTAGGFRLIRHYLPRYLLSPIATSRALTAERFDAAGVSVGSVAFRLPFTLSLSSVVFQDSDMVVSPSLDLTRFFRNDPGGPDPEPGFSLPMAGPNGSPSHPRLTATLDLLADGRLLAGGTRRFLADGSPDPDWHQARLSRPPIVSRLLPLPDGSVLAGGDFDLANASVAPGLCKLHPDGTLDPAFSSELDGRFVTKIGPHVGDTFLASFDPPVSDENGQQSSLARLDSRGKFIGLWPPGGPSGLGRTGSVSVTDFAVQSDGAVLVQTFTASEVPRATLHRLLADGTADQAFLVDVRYDLGASLFVLDDGTFFHGATRYGAAGAVLETVPLTYSARAMVQLEDRSVLFARQGSFLRETALSRWHPERGLDPEFVDPFLPGAPLAAFSFVTGVVPAARDKLFVWGSLHTPAGRLPLVRLHASGPIDPSFRLPPAPSLYSVAAVCRDPAGDSLWVAGSFEQLDGQPRPGLARLADSQADGFAAWIAAAAVHHDVSPDLLAPGADLDRDGCANFLEYAAPSDPAYADASRCGPRQVGPMRWRVPCNPEAPEIARRIEVSRDLSHWRPARADEVRLESHHPCLTWTLLPGHASLFTRVRLE